MYLPRIFRTPKIFWKKVLFFTTENKNVDMPSAMLKKYQKALKLINSRSYKDALSNISEIIEANPNLKGSNTYNNLLESQVNCLFFLREYSEAENNCMNIVEFTKFNIKNQNVEFSNSTLYHDYLKMLEIFLYSGYDNVFNKFQFLLIIVIKIGYEYHQRH